MQDPKWDGFVTVFTDASYCPSTGAAGWAVWMKHQGDTHRYSGIPKNPVKNPSHAEMVAAVYGISLAIKNYPDARTVHLVTDLLRTVEILRGHARAKMDYEITAYNYVYRMAKEHNVHISCKHVKAHVTQGERRNYVNNWCDQEAKKQMRKMRDDIKEVHS